MDTRSKELDNTAIPLPFEIYAQLKTAHMSKIEKNLHKQIMAFDKSLRIRDNREFFNITPEKALELLQIAASFYDEEDDIALGAWSNGNISPKRKPDASKKKRRAGRKVRSGGSDKSDGTWTSKTRLAKIIAKRGGNEGAFGSILQFFADPGAKARKPCRPGSKWRKKLDEAGIKFDANDYVVDWRNAKNPL